MITYKNETAILQVVYDYLMNPYRVSPGQTVTYEPMEPGGGAPFGYTGESYRYPRLDPTTFALKTVTHPHGEIHQGDAFAIHIIEPDFDKASEIGILFKTSDTVSWCHIVPLVGCGAASIFDILEAPTLDAGNYPTTFYTPDNRNRNSNNLSTVSSVQAVPVANKVSLKGKGDTTPISADGKNIHTEIIGVGKKGEGIAVRDTDEYVLKQNTVYYFRLKGTAYGADDTVATMEITWYELIDKE